MSRGTSATGRKPFAVAWNLLGGRFLHHVDGRQRRRSTSRSRAAASCSARSSTTRGIGEANLLVRHPFNAHARPVRCTATGQLFAVDKDVVGRSGQAGGRIEAGIRLNGTGWRRWNCSPATKNGSTPTPWTDCRSDGVSPGSAYSVDNQIHMARLLDCWPRRCWWAASLPRPPSRHPRRPSAEAAVPNHDAAERAHGGALGRSFDADRPPAARRITSARRTRSRDAPGSRTSSST